jgi:hypothetical protein
MEPENLLSCSQESSTGPYPQPDQSNPSYLPKIHFNISTHTRLGIPSGRFPSGFYSNVLCVFLLSSIRATCTDNLILLDFIILIILGE